MSVWSRQFVLASLSVLALVAEFSVSLSHAQSGTRQASQVANRAAGTRPLVAAPRAQQPSPFMPPVNRQLRLPVALRGFCSVTLRDQQEWSDGLEMFQHVFDGQIYWFVGRREQAIFAANPIRYVPVLRGDSVVTFAETGQRAPGDPQYGIIHNKRLYFFRNDAEQASFRAKPDFYTQADLKFDGQCVVSRIDDERVREGLPETTVIIDGLRYQFAGTHQQQWFLRNMPRYGVQQQLASHSEQATARHAISPSPTMPAGLAAKAAKEEKENRSKRVQITNIAMGGYCPVSIRNQGVWTKGDSQFAVKYDQQTYLLASESEQAIFKDNPAPFIPALGGYCVVTEIDENRREPGSNYHAAFHESEDRLFLFAGPEQKLAFNENPDRYLNADLAANGKCVVSLVDEQADVAGLPEFVTWHAGKRYYFASAEKLAKFATNKSLYQEF